MHLLIIKDLPELIERLFLGHLKRGYDSVGRAVDFSHDNEIAKVKYDRVKSGPKPGCLTRLL